MPQYQKVKFQKPTYEAFNKFRRDQNFNDSDIIRRIMNPEPFPTYLEHLNEEYRQNLLQAVFVGFELDRTPGQKLEDKINEEREKLRLMTSYQITERTEKQRYIQGLEDAAYIMGVIRTTI